MKKQTKKSFKNTFDNNNPKLDWKNKRDIITKSISMEVDLQNREIFFKSDIRTKLYFDLDSNNIDQLIKDYIHPDDSEQVMDSLTQAGQGQEKPIAFNFVHPHTSRSYKFEYRYQIIYVKYASTRLQGELVRT